MLTLSLFRAVAIAAAMIPWLLNLASRLLARILNMPEPLVQSSGAFVFAKVRAVENSFGKRLCPFRLRRRLRAWLRQLMR